MRNTCVHKGVITCKLRLQEKVLSITTSVKRPNEKKVRLDDAVGYNRVAAMAYDYSKERRFSNVREPRLLIGQRPATDMHKSKNRSAAVHIKAAVPRVPMSDEC